MRESSFAAPQLRRTVALARRSILAKAGAHDPEGGSFFFPFPYSTCHAARMRSIQMKSGKACDGLRSRSTAAAARLIADPSLPTGCCAFAQHDNQMVD